MSRKQTYEEAQREEMILDARRARDTRLYNVKEKLEEMGIDIVDLIDLIDETRSRSDY